MNAELDPLFRSGDDATPVPANQDEPCNLAETVEVEVKESITVEELVENGRVVEETVFKVIEVDIEGRKHRWHKEAITAAEIAELGGWHASHGVLHISPDNCERTLNELDEVKIEVGVSFAKRVRFKRG